MAPSVAWLAISIGSLSFTTAFFPGSHYQHQPASIRPSRISMSATADQRVVVGKGRVGLALKDMIGSSCILVGREDPVPADGTGPIYVCTRNDDLKSVVEKTPKNRREDLVFLQNGMLGPFLDQYGLERNTLALIYFAVAKKGEAPIDGKMEVNPEGLTAANGKWAQELAGTLQSAGLSCRVLDDAPFKAAMFEKLIWISAFMLVGAAHGGITVGEVEKEHNGEVVGLMEELAEGCSSLLGVEFEDGMVPRLCAYTRSVAHFPTAVKEFQWRNGFFWNLSEKEVSAGRPDPCPRHSALLKQVGAV